MKTQTRWLLTIALALAYLSVAGATGAYYARRHPPADCVAEVQRAEREAGGDMPWREAHERKEACERGNAVREHGAAAIGAFWPLVWPVMAGVGMVER